MGPVSAKLEEELRAAVVRGHLKIWLDGENAYGGFVEELIARRAAGQLPYDVHAYRGSHLELMMALEGVASGSETPNLVVHMPGFSEDSIRHTPVFELYAAGSRFRKALTTVISEAAAGIVAPPAIEAYVLGHGVTLAHADRWLANVAAASEAGLRGSLRSTRLPVLIDELLSAHDLARRSVAKEVADALWEHIEVQSGITEEWRALMHGGVRKGESWRDASERIAFATASWALVVEYVTDRKAKPFDPRLLGILGLPQAVTDASCGLAAHLRVQHPDLYRQVAQETEEALKDEVAEAKAEDLGRIDTFEFEEKVIFKAALKALADRGWENARSWAEGRLNGVSFWLDRPGSRRRGAWEVVLAAAQLGQALADAGPALAADSLPAALRRYQEAGAEADLTHRVFEERWLRANDARLDQREELLQQVLSMRRLWHTWADTWARDFSALCRDKGFLPPPALQQRTLFDEVLRPLAEAPGTTIYFMVDALRYEMAEALRRELGEPQATTIELHARYAELPTITAVGMNALTPVSNRGRLRPVILDGAIKGISQGEYQVLSWPERQRSIRERLGSRACPKWTLDEVMERDITRLRNGVQQADLVIVQVGTIDNAGEKGHGLLVFEQVLQKLRAAWNLLREAGARRFVFTSDHGFLLLDDGLRQAQSHGRKIDPWRRHALSGDAADNVDEVRVPLAELDYEGVGSLQLMMPAGTAVFDVGRRSLSFVHGGGSLQERVIPVLTIVHRHSSGSGGSTLAYRIEARASTPRDDLYSISAQVKMIAQHGLDFGGRQSIALSLRVVHRPNSQSAPIQVEPVQVRGHAKLYRGSIHAELDGEFKVYFRLSGPEEDRVQVELYHPTAEADVSPGVVEQRFLVSTVGVARPVEWTPGADDTPTIQERSTNTTSKASTPVNGPRAVKRENSPAPVSAKPRSAAPTPSAGREWLKNLPDGAREVFDHIDVHRSLTADQATRLLGSPRALRRFSRNFDEYRKLVPFVVRIESVDGIKRYVRE